MTLVSFCLMLGTVFIVFGVVCLMGLFRLFAYLMFSAGSRGGRLRLLGMFLRMLSGCIYRPFVNIRRFFRQIL